MTGTHLEGHGENVGIVTIVGCSPYCGRQKSAQSGVNSTCESGFARCFRFDGCCLPPLQLTPRFRAESLNARVKDSSAEAGGEGGTTAPSANVLLLRATAGKAEIVPAEKAGEKEAREFTSALAFGVGTGVT